MPKRRPNNRRRPAKRRRAARSGEGASAGGRIAVREVPGENAFELVYPRCVEARKEDLEEVHAMLAAGEIDLAVDELRWLLEGCRTLVEAHKLLGEIAAADDDWGLARGHFGYAYELGLAALPKDFRGPLPYSRPANRPFFEAGKGLAWCLIRLGDPRAAAEVIQTLLALDPSDPLNLKGLSP